MKIFLATDSRGTISPCGNGGWTDAFVASRPNDNIIARRMFREEYSFRALFEELCNGPEYDVGIFQIGSEFVEYYTEGIFRAHFQGLFKPECLLDPQPYGDKVLYHYWDESIIG